MMIDFTLPPELEAHDPPEARAPPARSATTGSAICPACCGPAT
jgi:hypothetical protein